MVSESNTLPTPAHVGHQRTESTSSGCNQWRSLAELALKVPHAGRNRSLVADTSRCGQGISWGRSHFPHDFRSLHGYLVHHRSEDFVPIQWSDRFLRLCWLSILEWLAYIEHTVQSLLNTCLFGIHSWSHTIPRTTQIQVFNWDK
jgi:hypothetical protein